MAALRCPCRPAFYASGPAPSWKDVRGKTVICPRAGLASPKLCIVVDIASATFFPGPPSTKARARTVEGPSIDWATLTTVATVGRSTMGRASGRFSAPAPSLFCEERLRDRVAFGGESRLSRQPAKLDKTELAQPDFEFWRRASLMIAAVDCQQGCGFFRSKFHIFVGHRALRVRLPGRGRTGGA